MFIRYASLAFTLSLGSFGIAQNISPASLSGRVADGFGKPLAADIMVYGRTMVDGRVDLFAMCSTVTDTEGTYECTKMRPGPYIVSANVRVAEVDRPQSKTAGAYPKTFFPAERELGNAEVVVLRAGQQSLADITVQASEPGKLHGEVPGHPKSVSFLLRSHAGRIDLPVKAKLSYDPAGRFVIEDIPPGTYRLSADWSISGEVHHGFGIAEVLPRDDQQVVMQETRQHQLAGTIHLAKDASLATQEPTSIELEGLKDLAGWRLLANVRQDGTFAFPPIADGEYTLRVANGGDTYVAGISQLGKREEGDFLRLTLDSQDAPIDVDLGRTRAIIRGTVGTDRLIPNKTGIVFQCIVDGRISVILADKRGHFEFRNVPPGEYRVFAWADLSQAEYRDDSVLWKLRDRSTSVTVDNDSYLTNIELTLILQQS